MKTLKFDITLIPDIIFEVEAQTDQEERNSRERCRKDRTEDRDMHLLVKKEVAYGKMIGIWKLYRRPEGGELLAVKLKRGLIHGLEERLLLIPVEKRKRLEREVILQVHHHIHLQDRPVQHLTVAGAVVEVIANQVKLL